MNARTDAPQAPPLASPRASKLKAVPPKKAEPSKPKVLVFGKPGVGKTWTSLDFPSVFYIDTEGGADLEHYLDKLECSGGVYLGPSQGACDFRTILEQVQALATERHPYKTLVIDSISKAFANEIAHEAERLITIHQRNEYGADRKPAVAYMRRLVAWLMRLDMNVVLIAHSKDEYGPDHNGNRVVIGQTFDCWDRLEYELHLCLQISKQGDRRVAKVRKSRLLGFPDAGTFPWSYEEFANRYGRDVMEKHTRQLELATPEQLDELKQLLDVVRLKEGQLESWLAAGGVSEFKDMDTDKIAKCISALKGKLPQ